jgi:hypothetical protein
VVSWIGGIRHTRLAAYYRSTHTIRKNGNSTGLNRAEKQGMEMEQAFKRVEKHLYKRHTSSPARSDREGQEARRGTAQRPTGPAVTSTWIVMLAAGHSSVQMHKRYVNLKGSDVAEAFGLSHTGLKKDVAS